MRRTITLAAVVMAAASALLSWPLAATSTATTGDTYVVPPSRYVIPPEVTGQFLGSYRMTAIGSKTVLYAADMFVTTNSFDDMYGGGEFYGYDNTGAQTDWTNILYDFRLVAPGGSVVTPDPWTTAAQVARDSLVLTLYGWGSPSLGTMTLRRQAGGDLAGSISLIGQPRAVSIRWKRIGGVS